MEVLGRQKLAVVGPVLRPTDKEEWELIWNGERIPALIRDFDFLEKLASHEWTFGIGDFIEADLGITKRLNNLGPWENSRYQVLKVHGVVSEPRWLSAAPDGQWRLSVRNRLP